MYLTNTVANNLRRWKYSWTRKGWVSLSCLSKIFEDWCNVEYSFKKHQLSCGFIFDSTVNIPKEPVVHDTSVSVATKSPLEQDVLKSSAAIASYLSATTSNLSTDVLPLNVDMSSTNNNVFKLDFPVPIEYDRFIFENIDMSSCFHDFQLQIKRRLDENKHLTLEENVQHLLTLSSILLLKPGRTHTDLHEHITLNQCKNLLIHLLNSNGITSQMFPSATKEKLEGIVHNLVDNVSNVSSCTF